MCTSSACVSCFNYKYIFLKLKMFLSYFHNFKMHIIWDWIIISTFQYNIFSSFFNCLSWYFVGLTQVSLLPAKLKWKKLQCSGIGPERRLGHSAVLVYGQVMFCLGRITGGRGWGCRIQGSGCSYGKKKSLCSGDQCKIPVSGHRDFFFVPRLYQVDQFTFHIAVF